MNGLEPLTTVREEPIGVNLLTKELSHLYGGGLSLDLPPPDRPLTIINFVTTMEGITSFALPGHAGGGDISGFNPQDTLIMGILRALADAVVVGANTLRTEPEHLWTPSFISGDHGALFQELRLKLGKDLTNPLNLFVTGSGNVLPEPGKIPAVFRENDIETLVITTESGKKVAEKELAGTGAEIVVFGQGHEVDLKQAFAYLRQEKKIGVLLVEGGAGLNGSIVEAELYDEVFLTEVPQIIGSSKESPRPLFVSGFARIPETALWHNLISVKLHDDYIYKRYRRRP